MHRQHMPTRGATRALETVKAEFERLRLAPPAKAAELVALKAAIAEMLMLIEDCLRFRRGGGWLAEGERRRWLE